LSESLRIYSRRAGEVESLGWRLIVSQTIARESDINFADKKPLVESAYAYTMALNIKDQETEKLAAEVAELTGESETVAVREALKERRDRLRPEKGGRPRKKGDTLRFLETEVWPHIPAEELDQPPMTKSEKEKLLGYGPEGY
jgi:antitoxin VapB